MCRSCEVAGGCENILNKVDMVDVSLEQRLELTIEVRNDFLAGAEPPGWRCSSPPC